MVGVRFSYPSPKAVEQPVAYRLLVILGGAYVIPRHSANIGRIIAGTEPWLGQDASKMR